MDGRKLRSSSLYMLSSLPMRVARDVQPLFILDIEATLDNIKYKAYMALRPCSLQSLSALDGPPVGLIVRSLKNNTQHQPKQADPAATLGNHNILWFD
jgi:hypothetical protein